MRNRHHGIGTKPNCCLDSKYFSQVSISGSPNFTMADNEDELVDYDEEEVRLYQTTGQRVVWILWHTLRRHTTIVT